MVRMPRERDVAVCSENDTSDQVYSENDTSDQVKDMPNMQRKDRQTPMQVVTATKIHENAKGAHQTVDKNLQNKCAV
jgi:hypothetical protein